MIKSIEKEINGNRYIITQLPARQNFVFIAKWTKKLKAIAPLLNNLPKGGVADVLKMDLNSLDIGGMIESFCDNLNPQELSDLLFDSFKTVNVITATDDEQKQINLSDGLKFDMFFAGKMKEMFLVLFEILKITVFGDDTDFFTKITIKMSETPSKQVQKTKDIKNS